MNSLELGLRFVVGLVLFAHLANAIGLCIKRPQLWPSVVRKMHPAYIFIYAGVLIIVFYATVTLTHFFPAAKLNIFDLAAGRNVHDALRMLESAAPVRSGAHLWLTQATLLLTVLVFGFLQPVMAYAEERLFRRNRDNILAVVLLGALSGFAYVLYGLPIAFGAAMCIPGMLFGAVHAVKYHKRADHFSDPEAAREEALLTSAAHHALFNWPLVLAVGWLYFFD